MPPREPSAEFQEAVKNTKKFTKMPSDSDSLKLYPLFKVARQEEAAEPTGFLDFRGKAKFDAWTKIKTKDPEDAEKEYIALVESMKETYGFDPNKNV